MIFGESAILRAWPTRACGAVEVAGPGCSRGLGRRLGASADRLGLVGIAGSDFHAPDRPGRWVGAVTTDAADLERLRTRSRLGRTLPKPPRAGCRASRQEAATDRRLGG